MRLSLATGIGVALAAALFAGCSTSPQGTSAVPGSSTVGQTPMGTHGGHYIHLKGKTSREQILRYEIAGKLPAPVRIDTLKWQLAHMKGQSAPRFRITPNGGKPAAWSSDVDFSYLIGLTKKNKPVMAVNTANNGCYDPIVIKIDHSKNVWTSCEFNSAFEAGAAQEYSSAGSLKNTYNVGCPSSIPPSECYYFFSESFDQAENSSTVFAGLVYYEYCNASFLCTDVASGGFEYWPNGSPGNQATLLTSNLPGVTVEDTGYFDVDASNNIYYTFDGCDNVYPYTCGYGLAEYANATSPSGTQSVLLPPGSIGFWGGVSVGGNTLSIIDQDTRMVTQYALPWTGSPMATWGPTAQNAFGLGDPVAGGYNAAGGKMLIGDGYGWLDALTSSGAKIDATPDCIDGCDGAGYTPSNR
jgi:hypothetical protein